jgi:hypothetical protein
LHRKAGLLKGKQASSNKQAGSNKLAMRLFSFRVAQAEALEQCSG